MGSEGMSLETYAAWVLQPQLPARPVPLRTSYFVCGTPRSGTWLLCGLLASTGVAGRPHEWFWRETEDANRRAWGCSRFVDYLADVRDAGTTPNGVFGAKLMWAYLVDFLARLRQLGDAPSDRSLIARQFQAPRFVWVRRDDVVAQAVSWAKAIQTGRWHHWDRRDSATAPAYDRDQIDALVREVAAHDVGWRAWFAANEIEPLAIRFEDLVSDSVGVTRAVLNFLGVAARDVPINALTVEVSDGVNEQWIARYRRGSR
jgi:trehalose 2-sulfotransferase